MTDFEPMPLADFMATLPAQASGRQDRKPGKPAPKKSAVKEAAIAYPWLEEFVPESKRSSGSRKNPAAAAASSGQGSEGPVPEDSLAHVWDELDQKRSEWAALAGDVGDDFVTVLRGGPWTQAHMGKATDRCAAQAKPGVPVSWCAMYGLNKLASFSFSVYGEVGAFVLSAEWCRRMQYYFDLWLSGPDDYSFKPEDREGYKPSDEWLRFKASLPNSSKALQRVAAIDSLFPSSAP